MENIEPKFSTSFETGSGEFDLGIPGLVAECISELYASTGVAIEKKDRVPYIAALVGVLTGMAFGFDRDGMLYGPIGAALGSIFGAVAGTVAGLLIHIFAAPFYRPESVLLKQLKLANYKNASVAIARIRWWIWRGGNGFARLAELILSPLGFGRSDMPPDIALSNIAAAEGILAEAVGDVEAAVNSYMKSLDMWNRHTFVLASLVELVIRENLWEYVDKTLEYSKKYIERARDLKFLKSLDEHLAFLEERKNRKAEAAPLVAAESAASNDVVFRLIENPGSQISNGSLVMKRANAERSVKLAPMPFHFILTLLENAMHRAESEDGKNEAQLGWVSIRELLENLPWTTSYVTNSNVHKLVYKVRNQLEKYELDRNLIEENQNGCYRFNAPPEIIKIERVHT